jgi:hypothetical protein
MKPNFDLYYAAQAAEKCFEEALKKQYGNALSSSWYASNHNSETRTALDAKIRADKAWIAEATRKRKMKTTIKVDYENNAEQWWQEANSRVEECPFEVRRLLFSDEDEITVDQQTAEQFRAWASTLPGWADGPKFARNPVVFCEE